MGRPAARRGDRVKAIDTHFIRTPPGPVVPVPHAFDGVLDGGLSANVRIGGEAAATVGSTVTNQPPHTPNGGTFAQQPTNRGTVLLGSTTVRINGKPAARAGDPVVTCNDPVDRPGGTIVASGSVRIGG